MWTNDLSTREYVDERSTKGSTEDRVDNWIGARGAEAEPCGDRNGERIDIDQETREKIDQEERRPQENKDGKDDQQNAHGFAFVARRVLGEVLVLLTFLA